MSILRKGSRKIISQKLTFLKTKTTTKIVSAIFLVLFIDQISKLLAQNYSSRVIFKNQGIAFGIFPNFGTVLVLLTLIVLTFYLLHDKKLKLDNIAIFGMGMLLGGGISNLIDRLRIGYVVDFISFGFLTSFNLADVAVVIGTFVVLVRGIYVAKNK